MSDEEARSCFFLMVVLSELRVGVQCLSLLLLDTSPPGLGKDVVFLRM